MASPDNVSNMYIGSEEKCIYTTANSVKYRCSWLVTNFKNWHGELTSPTFSTKAIHSSKWQIHLTWGGTGYINAYLQMTSVDKTRIHVVTSVLNSKSETWATNNTGALVTEAYKNYFIIRFDINGKCVEDASIGNSFTVVCDMDIFKGSTSVQHEYNSSLINHFSELLDKQIFTDVILNIDGTEFGAHKAILASRSEVFATMFNQQFEESQTNRIEIKDMDTDVAQAMLRFIYTEKSPNLEKMAVDLLPASDKYALHDLKALCVRELSLQLTLDTAVQTLILADRHHVDKLKIQAMDLIAENAHLIRQTDGWVRLKKEYPLLYEEMFERKFFGAQTTTNK